MLPVIIKTIRIYNRAGCGAGHHTGRGNGYGHMSFCRNRFGIDSGGGGDVLNNNGSGDGDDDPVEIEEDDTQ
jgi:hypothetical protein